jgi:hypothetical protein
MQDHAILTVAPSEERFPAMKSVEVPEVETLDEDMRVARGFRVYSPDGYAGVVEAVRRGSEEAPTTLGVRAGLFVPRTILVPADLIACVIPRERRVLLNVAAEQPSLLSDLQGQLRLTVAARGAGNEGVVGRVCVLDAAVGSPGLCRREECPFWETGGAVLSGGCIVVRSGVDLDRAGVAELLIESRRTLELADSPPAREDAHRVVRQLLLLDSNGDVDESGEPVQAAAASPNRRRDCGSQKAAPASA